MLRIVSKIFNLNPSSINTQILIITIINPNSEFASPIQETFLAIKGETGRVITNNPTQPRNAKGKNLEKIVSLNCLGCDKTYPISKAKAGNIGSK